MLIIGGGQGGIAIGARLRQLGVPTIIIDKLEFWSPEVNQRLIEPQPVRPRRAGLNAVVSL